MESYLNDQFSSLRQHVSGPLDSGNYGGGGDAARSSSPPETVNVDLTVSSHSSARGLIDDGVSAFTTPPASSTRHSNAGGGGGETATAVPAVAATIGASSSATPSRSPPVSDPHVAASTNQSAPSTVLAEQAAPSSSSMWRGGANASPATQDAPEPPRTPPTGARMQHPLTLSLPAAMRSGGVDGVAESEAAAALPSAPQHEPRSLAGEPASSTTAAQLTPAEMPNPDPSPAGLTTTTSVEAKTPAKQPPPLQQQQAERTPTKTPTRKPSRRAAHRTPAPSKPTPKKMTPTTSARIADLLSGKTAATSSTTTATPEKSQLAALPPLDSLDLPLGLLLLYCAAEDASAAGEANGTTATGPSASLSTAYSLLYMLEQLSDQRRRHRRRAARQQASATEEAKCNELFAAAERRRVAYAVLQAARAQEVAEAELGPCTFHPEVTPTAQGMAGKGTKDFLAKCLEWKHEAARRLQHKYEQQAQLEAEQAAAAAAAHGVARPGEAMTEHSRQLLEDPGVQQRLKSRPGLWEARKPAAAPTVHDVRGRTVVASSSCVDANGAQLGVPAGPKLLEEQAAVLRSLRGPGGAEGTTASLVDRTDAQQRRQNSETVQRFMSRLAEDKERREATAARLQARFHDPEMASYEATTGQPLFVPNAMPTVWKDGRRVGYDDLTPEEQEAFRAELRSAGLEYVLTRHRRAQRSSSAGEGETTQHTSAAAAETAVVGQEASLTAAQRDQFLASLQNALTRREQNMQRILAQATAEETFHPRLTPRSIRLARHKIGNVPIYERTTVSRSAAAAASATPVKASKDTTRVAAAGEEDGQSTSADAMRSRPLPAATEVFLARSEQWLAERQRRLEQLAAREEEKRYGGCTFAPNRTFFGSDSAMAAGQGGATAGAPSATPLGSSRAGSEQAGQRLGSSRYHDGLATAADVRLMNELELLRSGAAFRDEQFVQAVCERSGVADARHAMANLSLHSAPRLTGRRGPLSAQEESGLGGGSQTPPSRRLSPIAARSQRPSASPYHVPARLGLRAEASSVSPTATGSGGRRSAPMTRTESGATQTPTRQSSRMGYHGAAAAGAHAPLVGGVGSHAGPSLPEDPWAALDAQTDAILKRHGY